MSQVTLGFLRGIVIAIVGAVALYVSDATHLGFLSPYVAGLVAAIASAIDHAISTPGSTGLFGSVSVR